MKSLQFPCTDRGIFHKPQIQVAPAAEGEIGFVRPKKEHGNGLPLIVVRGV